MTAIPFVAPLSEPRYGTPVRLSPLVRRVVAENPSKYSYMGTGTYIIGNGDVAVIDPGPDLDSHRDALVAALAGETVRAILVTHCHSDHSPLAAWLRAETSAPTVAFGPHGSGAHTYPVLPDDPDDIEPDPDEPASIGEALDLAFTPDVVLGDGGVVDLVPGLTIRGVYTPGHTANHLCFAVDEEQALFTGDHVMGWSTTVVSPPDGDMAAYLESLRSVAGRHDALLYPTHGNPVADPGPFLDAYLEHRLDREAAVLAQVRAGVTTVPDIVAVLYVDVRPELHKAAGRSVLAHLVKLTGEGRDRRRRRRGARGEKRVRARLSRIVGPRTIRCGTRAVQQSDAHRLRLLRRLPCRRRRGARLLAAQRWCTCRFDRGRATSRRVDGSPPGRLGRRPAAGRTTTIRSRRTAQPRRRPVAAPAAATARAPRAAVLDGRSAADLAGPDQLGRGLLVVPGADVPEPWSAAERLVLDEATLDEPAPAIAQLQEWWRARRRFVVEVAIADARLAALADADERRPLHVLGPRFTLAGETLQHLVTANSVDARREPAVWPLLADAVAAGAAVATAGRRCRRARRRAAVARRRSHRVQRSDRRCRRRAPGVAGARVAAPVRDERRARRRPRRRPARRGRPPRWLGAHHRPGRQRQDTRARRARSPSPPPAGGSRQERSRSSPSTSGPRSSSVSARPTCPDCRCAR